MIFQTLDDKKECVGIYANNQLVFKNKSYSQLTKSWSYSPYLSGLDIEYADLYCEGKTLNEACPEIYKEELEKANKKIKSFINSFINSKVSLNENCFFDLVPKRILIEYCEVKNKICNHIFSTVEKPKEYDFLRKFNEVLTDIKFRDLNLDLDALKVKLWKKSAVNLHQKLLSNKKNISYNLFGSKTGRLATAKGSFPVLSFSKQYRHILKPQNDWFIELDINAAEIRTALALLNKPQPEGDLYEWIAQECYTENTGRSEAKNQFISWLYNSSAEKNENFEKVVSKEALKAMYYVNGKIHTPFSRAIDCDEHHSISYLNQSTFIDLFHRQIIKINDYLKGKTSFISFLLHDSVVLDISNDEKEEIVKIVKILQDTKYGKFLVSVKAGKNYGEMKKLNLKVEND